MSEKQCPCCGGNGWEGSDCQQQRWIPVGERLPNSYLTVLSLSKNGDIKVDFVQPKKIWYLGRNNVTHWMPLPKPPKEVQG